MKRLIAQTIAVVMLATSIFAAPAAAQPDSRHDRRPPPGHEFRPPPPPDEHWDRGREPPPYWDRRQWEYRQRYLRRQGHDDDDHDAAIGLVAGVILGFVLGAAVADTEDRQAYARSRLDDPAWIASCARRYRSFDPYTGTYLSYDGLRHYCR